MTDHVSFQATHRFERFLALSAKIAVITFAIFPTTSSGSASRIVFLHSSGFVTHSPMGSKFAKSLKFPFATGLSAFVG